MKTNAASDNHKRADTRKNRLPIVRSEVSVNISGSRGDSKVRRQGQATKTEIQPFSSKA